MKRIHELFEAQAALTPDAEALVYENSSLTYRELDVRAEAIAAALREAGIGPDALVGLCMERSFDLVAAMLGIFKAGGAYVPLDPALPEMRIAYMLEDAKPLAVLTRRHFAAALPPHRARLVLVDEAVAAAEPVAGAPPARADSENLAYVLYTSGSTGHPKGVQIPHRAVINMLASMQRRPGLRRSDRMLALTTIAFDISVLEIFLPLSAGACAVIATGDAARDGEKLRRLIEDQAITIMQATPATLQMLLEAGWQGAPELRILCGGEAWSAGLAAQLLARCGALWNMYGPTETTVWSAVAKVEPGQPVVVGRPIANTRFHVLDGGFRLVPVGVPGELYIGGAGLARGYLNRPELDRERFVPDPFTGDGARLYRTGDLVKRLPDGTLEFLGRIDQQVKIRGHRIEPGEVETALLRHEAVERCVVTAYAGADGQQNLAAYFVPAADRTLAAQALRLFLSESLPFYMIPAAFIPLATFPLTPSGKIDRKALPAPEPRLQTPEADFVEPVTAIEKQLAGIWAEMLNIGRVGLRDNFFNLGGHSLLALRTINEINKRLKLRLNVPDFFQRPTIEQLAAEIVQHGPSAAATRVIQLQEGNEGLPVYFMGARPDEYRLAQLINENRSVYLVDAKLPAAWLAALAAGNRKSLPRMEELGRLFGEALLAHAGAAPCVVAGYSLGGQIGFEAAHVLRRAGGRPEFLLLIDARAFTWNGFAKFATVLRSVRMVLGSLSLRPGHFAASGSRLTHAAAKAWRLTRWQIASVPTAIGYRLQVLNHRKQGKDSYVAAADKPSGFFDSEGNPIGMWVIYRLTKLMGDAWRPRPLQTAGALIRARADVDMLPGYDRAHGWRNLFRGGFEILQSEGDHLSILTDVHAESLARRIEFLLRRHAAVPAPRAADAARRKPARERHPGRAEAMRARGAV